MWQMLRVAAALLKLLTAQDDDDDLKRLRSSRCSLTFIQKPHTLSLTLCKGAFVA